MVALLALATQPASALAAEQIGASGATPPPIHRLIFQSGTSGGWLSKVAVSDPSRVHRLLPTHGAELVGSTETHRHIFYAQLSRYSSIRRVRPDGTHQTILVRNIPNPAAIATAGTYIYWLDEQAIGRVRLDGSAIQRRFIVLPREAGGGVGEGLVTDGTHLFFSRCQSDSIGRVGIDGSNLTTHFIRSRHNSCPQGLAIDRQHLYWTELLFRHDLGYIGRAQLNGSEIQPDWFTVRTDEGPFNLAVGFGHVYWTWGGSPRGAKTWIGRARLDKSGFTKRFVEGSGGLSLY